MLHFIILYCTHHTEPCHWATWVAPFFSDRNVVDLFRAPLTPPLDPGRLEPSPWPGPWPPPPSPAAKAKVGIEGATLKGNILGGSLCKLTAGGERNRNQFVIVFSGDCNFVSKRGYAAPSHPWECRGAILQRKYCRCAARRPKP